MVKPLIEPGAVIDGFTIGERVHQGGMATLWSVTRPDDRRADADEGAADFGRRGSGCHRRLRDGADDPAAAVGAACAACFGAGDFAAQPYVVIERIPGKTLYDRLSDLPIPYEEARVIAGKDRRPRWPTCTGRTSSITTSSRAASCFAPAAKRC